ncbi:hypothetical protein BTA51_14425 [Hahella sp. CCB-MM4]|uniref:hypothetical protein n=1 Tax=Hahella sp. (strain CCB-MM4) TaxID=1926491 RepID=UPI000B9A28DA|nr:hypothetical protein [Hahella sp. CCB-MM4]OZG72717.1 hypothetical protein BTA51_14425 [Hahella sp. CCB-MM4]
MQRLILEKKAPEDMLSSLLREMMAIAVLVKIVIGCLQGETFGRYQDIRYQEIVLMLFGWGLLIALMKGHALLGRVSMAAWLIYNLILMAGVFVYVMCLYDISNPIDLSALPVWVASSILLAGAVMVPIRLLESLVLGCSFKRL